MLIFGMDAQQNVWYLCCSGIRFTKAIDPQTIDVDLNQAILHQHDPFWSNISQNDRIGVGH